MSELTTPAGTLPLAAPAAIPASQDDLRIANWLCTGDLDLELDRDETVGAVKQSYRDMYLTDCASRCWPTAIFLAADGRMYTAEIDVVVRPATQEEVREAVENEKESALDEAQSRVNALDGYLRLAGT